MGKPSVSAGPPPVDYAAETKARNEEQAKMDAELEQEKQQLLTRQAEGRKSLMLTGGEGVQEEGTIEKKSLLGSSTKVV